MKLFRMLVMALIMFATAEALHCRVAVAVEQPGKGGEDPTLAPLISHVVGTGAPAGDAAAKKAKKKKVVIKRKKVDKKAAKERQAAEPVVSPGEKLTINQVMDALNTTRDLSGKNLSGMQLVGINLSKCNLKGSDLSHANLERADLGESSLERVNFNGANLKMANLRLAGLTAVNMELAILDGAIWLDGRVCAKGSYGQCNEPLAPTAALRQPATSPASTVQAPSGSRP